MVSVSVFGRKQHEIEQEIGARYPGLELVDQGDAELVISYGGDGTFLYAEHHFPNTPKVLLRNTMLCSQCTTRSRDQILQLIEQRDYTIVPHKKLEANVNGKRLLGVYDITIGHARINTALRLRSVFNGQMQPEEIVGDGVVVATTLGATGYYQSITRSTFTSGIGVAFNNSVNTTSHTVVAEDTDMTFEITRGPGVVVTDNIETLVEVNDGDVITVKRAEEELQLVTFHPPHTKLNFAMNRLPGGVCQFCGQRYQNV